jgi:hypothetical protein
MHRAHQVFSGRLEHLGGWLASGGPLRKKDLCWTDRSPILLVAGGAAENAALAGNT